MYELHEISMRVYELFSIIFTQELALKEQKKEQKEMVPAAQRRKSFVAFPNIQELTPEFQEAAGFSLAAHGSSMVVPGQIDEFPSQESSDPVPQQLTLRTDMIGKTQLPSIGSLGALNPSQSFSRTSMDDISSQTPPSNDIEIERPETGEKIYVQDEANNDNQFAPLETNMSEEAAPPAEEEEFIANLVRKEEDLHEQEDGDEIGDSSGGESEKIPEIVTEEVATETIESLSANTKFSNTYQSNQNLLNLINSVYNPFSDFDYRKIQALADKVPLF
jgi:hypothetical protein